MRHGFPGSLPGVVWQPGKRALAPRAVSPPRKRRRASCVLLSFKIFPPPQGRDEFAGRLRLPRLTSESHGSSTIADLISVWRRIRPDTAAAERCYETDEPS